LPDLVEVLGTLEDKLDALASEPTERRPSRWVGQAATASAVEEVAKGGRFEGARTVPAWKVAGAEGSGVEVLRDIRAARRGDPDAHRRLTKGWVEGTPASGGFLVNPEILPGYIEARRAASPLRERCATFDVSSDEVWVVTEGDSITVAHVAEGATKPDTTGTVAQKVSTVFKVAGTTHLSDELLADSNGNAAQLVARQFAAQTGIAIDSAIISGTGTGQPTGLRNAAGINAQAVDGQDGPGLYASIVKAINRIAQRFETADTVVMHPRDAVKFTLARDGGTTGSYLFPGGVGALFPGVTVVLDANIPTGLGVGTNESIIIVGAFRRGAYFFSRQPLTIDASSDAAFVTDETVFRAVERYGFAVVLPSAFELLTGITP
jgi:HK97 family phage major capsid protein